MGSLEAVSDLDLVCITDKIIRYNEELGSIRAGFAVTKEEVQKEIGLRVSQGCAESLKRAVETMRKLQRRGK
jgi:hypothetical protein